ncbi:hypothetical protein MJO28_002482 [Puccinia striiformis f. sp. tritici]|uniref:Uncharacterized protein n=1 Tax=Puccinia striiformis f. sp. tritici TaxID=168172 RepID=A0ACC0EPU1_9BASI|nr:hypothetical protein MJO28_002482 [Puccinia striiformis f. sp. tritici]
MLVALTSRSQKKWYNQASQWVTDKFIKAYSQLHDGLERSIDGMERLADARQRRGMNYVRLPQTQEV